jgi:hypothetical protein
VQSGQGQKGRMGSKTAAEQFVGRTCEQDIPHVQVRTGRTAVGPYSNLQQQVEVILVFQILLCHCKFFSERFSM